MSNKFVISLHPSRILLDNNRSIEDLDLETRIVRILPFKFQCLCTAIV